MSCVDVCPVEDTLQLETVGKKKKINKRLVAIGVISIFMLVTGFGMMTGNWQNKITKEQYLKLYENMNSFGHPTGTKAMKEFNEEALNKDANKKLEKEKINNKTNSKGK